MRTPRLFLGIFALALLLLACRGSDEPADGPSQAQTSAETDREALVAFYNATGSPNWNGNKNWLSDMPMSEWPGVYTDDNGRVTALWLQDIQLSGEIPPELGNLANLEVLDLNFNQLSRGDSSGVGQPSQLDTTEPRQ